jgi:hypothetical protein
VSEAGVVGGYFQPFNRPLTPLVREFTFGDAASIMPIDRSGRLGRRLEGLEMPRHGGGLGLESLQSLGRIRMAMRCAAWGWAGNLTAASAR